MCLGLINLIIDLKVVKKYLLKEKLLLIYLNGFYKRC